MKKRLLSHFRTADQSQLEVSVIVSFGRHPNNFHTVPEFYSDVLMQTKYIILVLNHASDSTIISATLKSLRL